LGAARSAGGASPGGDLIYKVDMSAPIVYLVGFMGTGKSAVGARLAELLGWNFIDLDQAIERRAGTTITQIFSLQGEACFRAFEREELWRASGQKNTVVSVGGGAFCCSENQEIITATGISVWLDAPVELIFPRCCDDGDERPLFATMREMAELMELRRPFYENAQMRVEVGSMGVEDLARVIMEQVFPEKA
jgi:shikimate kinase